MFTGCHGAFSDADSICFVTAADVSSMGQPLPCGSCVKWALPWLMSMAKMQPSPSGIVAAADLNHFSLQQSLGFNLTSNILKVLMWLLMI